MLKPKEKIVDYLITQFKKIAFDIEKINNICNILQDKFDIPTEVSSDIIMMRRQPDEYSDFILFAIMNEINENVIPNYFTKNEIEMYSSAKLTKKKINFPIVFDAIEITDDQWLTRTSLQQMILFRDAGLMNYDSNTQRAMRRFEKDGVVLYKIAVNKSQVSEIANSIRRHEYIPDTLTLNIPTDSDADFVFNDGKLIIRQLDHFNITDGYHRVCALSRINGEDEDFDYPMELRITNFSDPKAQQFIFQADQKTKMKKIDSDQFNHGSIANTITRKLNEDPSFELYGKVIRNGGAIRAAELARLVDYFYVSNISIKNERLYSTQIATLLRERINYLMQERLFLYEQDWTYEITIAALFAINKAGDDIREIPVLFDRYRKAIEELSSSKKLHLFIKDSVKRPYNKLDKYLTTTNEVD